MRLILCFLLLLAAVLPVRAEVVGQMAVVLHEQGLTGAVWSLVTPDGVTTGAAGLADAAAGTPMRSDHRV